MKRLGKGSGTGFGLGTALALILVALAGSPVSLLEAANAVAPKATTTGTPLTPTPTPCINAATPTPIPTGVIPGPTGSPTGVPATATATPCAQPTNTPTATPAPSGGGGGGGTSGQSTTVTPPGIITASQLTGNAPANLTVTVNVAAGANILAGNVGLTVPANFAAVANANVSITTTLPPGVSISGLAGNVVGSPNGTVFDLNVTDAATGAQVTSFNAPVTFTALPNAADLAIASGNPAILTVIYFTAPNTSPVFNPLGLPSGTPVFQPGVTHNPDGTLSWNNQNGAGVVQAVVANPVSYVQTLNPTAQEYSSFDPNASQSFGGKPQFSYLQVTEPQIPGVNRLVVLDPDTGNYSYVNARDVAPSGAPPARSSSAVVRGVRN